MNRELLKSIDTERIPIERLISLLQTFTLKHAARLFRICWRLLIRRTRPIDSSSFPFSKRK